MRGLRRSRNASAGLWNLNLSESQVDRGEAELKGEVETRKEKPEETGSRRSECGSASEGTARSGEKPRGTDGRTGREHQASANVRIASEDFCIVLRNRASEDSDREPSVLQRMVFERPIQCERTATGGRTLKTAQGKAMKDARAALSRKSLRRGRERKLARSSEKERRVDARALIADEGRDKLRKAMGSRK